MTTDTERRCEICREFKPLDAFASYRHHRCVSRRKVCKVCDKAGYTATLKPGSPPAPVTADDVLQAWETIRQEGYKPSYRLLAERLNTTSDVIYKRIKALRKVGRIPDSAPLANEARSIFIRLTEWLDRRAIGGKHQDVTERLDLVLTARDATIQEFIGYRATIKTQERRIAVLEDQLKSYRRAATETGKMKSKGMRQLEAWVDSDIEDVDSNTARFGMAGDGLRLKPQSAISGCNGATEE